MSYHSSTTRSRRSIESFNHDGMEIARRRRHRRGLPLGQILLFVFFVFAFKIFLALHMGLAGYGAKMNMLAEGGMMEQLAASAMVLDPISEWIVEEIRSSPY